MSDLDRGLHDELAVALRAPVAGHRLPDVGEPRLVVPPGLDTA